MVQILSLIYTKLCEIRKVPECLQLVKIVLQEVDPFVVAKMLQPILEDVKSCAYAKTR